MTTFNAMKTLLAIASVLLVGGVFLVLTEPYTLSGIVFVVLGLSPFALWVPPSKP